MKTLYFILTILCFSACSNYIEPENGTERQSLSFEFDSLAQQESFNLKIQKKDSFLIYRYQSKTDSATEIILRFNTKSEILRFALQDFEVFKSNFFENEKVSQEPFDLYKIKIPEVDANGPMLFNEKYGILNIDNSIWSYQYLFLPQNDESIATEILNKLNNGW